MTIIDAEQKCDCGAPTEGKWADIHHPTCPAVLRPDAAELLHELVRALKPFANLGVGSGPDYETETYRIERRAIREARAAIAKALGAQS